jgi:enamine deaminase RidA (YjgF/YER057c/UK114 family)
MKAKSWLLGSMVLLMSACCTHNMNGGFAKEFIHSGKGYSKAIVIKAHHTKTIYLSGLTGEGVDLASQTRSTYNHIKEELDSAGATLQDIVKTNTYIVNMDADKVTIFRGIRKEVLGEQSMPASTLIGVQSLADSDKLIEIEAVAVVREK